MPSEIMPSECNFYSDTERNLDKPIRKSMQFETFKKLDFGDAKHSLTSDLLLRAKILGQLSQLKSGTKLCNECIHHAVKDNNNTTIIEEPRDNCKHNNLVKPCISPKPTNVSTTSVYENVSLISTVGTTSVSLVSATHISNTSPSASIVSATNVASNSMSREDREKVNRRGSNFSYFTN